MSIRKKITTIAAIVGGFALLVTGVIFTVNATAKFSYGERSSMAKKRP